MKTQVLKKQVSSSLLLAISLGFTAGASAEIVSFNFENVPLPSGALDTFSLPYTEEGLRLTSNSTLGVILGPTNARYTGFKAKTPSTFATGEDVTFNLVSTTGRPFAVRSVTLHPWAADPGLTMFIPAPLPADVRIVFSQSISLNSWVEQTRRTGFGTGSAWTGGGSTRIIESNNPSGRTITLRASIPSGQRPRLFLRNSYEYVAPSGGS